MNLEQILQFSLKQNASDLHFISEYNLYLRIDGILCEFTDFFISTNWILTEFKAFINPTHLQILHKNGQIDFAISFDFGRFRVNLFKSFTGFSAVIRIISAEIPTLNSLKIPLVLTELIQKKQGLILITGSTGSGKSTTLASLIQFLNENWAKNIITLEDPIEFIYKKEKSIIYQRELETHFSSFNEAILAALRQDPDILLIGELRDQKTIKLALNAAETGHLVLATLHTNSAICALERLIFSFLFEESQLIKMQLSSSLIAIVSQQLLLKKLGGRIAIFEILINNPAVNHLIREGKLHQILSIMQTNKSSGMQLFSDEMNKIEQQFEIDKIN